MIFQDEKTPFQVLKKQEFQKFEILTFFQRGQSSWFWSKIVQFSTLFFQAISARKMCFIIFQNEKTTVKVINKRSSKRRKTDIFPKGANPWFWSKIGHFSTIFFQELQAIKMCFMIFQNEETTFKVINKRSSKRRKTDIFPKGANPWFWSKIGHFSTIFFQAIQAIKMCFMIFQKKKTRFQAIKTTSLKSRNIDNFPVKLLIHGFCPKLAIFAPHFFRQCRPEKCGL